MANRIFSAHLEQNTPEVRIVDNDAPAGMRLEILDAVFGLAENNRDARIADAHLYRRLVHSMGLAGAPASPMSGFREGAVRQIKTLPWPRVYDLICRWWSEFPRELQAEYLLQINPILNGYRIAWELSANGRLRRVMPVVVQNQVEATFQELSAPRFAPALESFRTAMSAYDERPQRSRDACRNAMDALESIAKEIVGMARATFGDVLIEVRRRQSISTETISVLQKLYNMANGHFRHGMTTPFALVSAEVDFVVVSCMGGILLFARL